MAKTQTFNGFVKFVGTEAAYNTLKAESAGKLIFAEITDITPAQSVTDMTGTGDQKIHEFRIFANGIEYNLTNRAAFNAAVAKLREAASINVNAFTEEGAEIPLINAGTLQATLEELAVRIKNNAQAGKVTLEHTGDTTTDLVYTIRQGGEFVGDINIPRDQFLKEAEIVQGTYDPQSGFTPINISGEHSASADAHTYIHFVFVVRDTTGETPSYAEKDVYLDASALIDVYAGLSDQSESESAVERKKTEDILVHVDENNKIYAVIRPNGALETRINDAIAALAQAQELSSANKGIKIESGATGTTLTLQHATSHVTGQSTSDVDYLEISAENENEGIRIAEGAIQHDIVSGSASTKLVTEAAVWNTLAWDVYEPAAANEPLQQS